MQPTSEGTGEVVKALALARAIKEEAMTGEQTPRFLVWQLAAAVEMLAAALARQTEAVKG